MAIYKTKGGVSVKLSNREVKQTIMKAHGWTNEQYRKQYDLFKNKLRAFESFEKAHGKEVKAQSPQELLYRQSKAMLREGSEYKPSSTMQRIQAFSAVSITKGRKLAQDLDSVYTKRREEAYAAVTAKAFDGLIRDVPKAQEIVNSIEDPVKREEALKALADHIHAAQTPSGEVFAGETFGSDTAGEDFDYSQWLD